MKFKVGDRVIYETCSNLDQGYPELVGYQGTVVDFGRLFIYVEFTALPDCEGYDHNILPCSEEELAHV